MTDLLQRAQLLIDTGRFEQAEEVLARALLDAPDEVGSSRVDLQACKLEYSIVSPK